MNPLAWMLGIVLPACGFAGAKGLPAPPLVDIRTLRRPSAPNVALAAPSDFSPTPDIATQDYPVPPETLFAMIRSVASRQPRTFLAALYVDLLQAHYVARTPLLNFPDLVLAQVRQAGPNRSQLILYSRSVYGHSDLGVNRRRLETWLEALKAALPH